MSQNKIIKSIAFGLIVATSLLADDPETEPGRPVARISLIQGDVTVRRGDSGDWVAAAPNAPMVVLDRLVTGPASRAEMQLDYANFARISADAELRLSELEDRRYGIQLAAGTMTYRVLRDQEAEVEISTPSVAIRPLKKGMYRISVSPDGTTEVTVRNGEVEIYSPRGTERLRSGKTMLVRGTIDDPEFQFVAQIPDDEWDQWNVRRDRDLERSSAYRYVSTSIYGAEDLDNNGHWVYDAPYGNVWVPTVSAGWAPYRYGRWAWVDFYGWSWVSYDPWGWAPYHYGRWYQGTFGWAWYPGAIRSRHYWTPAQVAWIGFGGNSGYRAGIGIGWGNVGWVPLAPHEPYYPWYGSRNRGGNRTVVNNNTVVNNINITNVYRNARGGNGITSVNSNDFVNGRSGNYVRAGENDIRGASVVRGQLPLAPDRGSLRLGEREVAGTPRAAARDNSRFVSRRSPTQVDRVTFDQQRRTIDDSTRRSFGDHNAAGGGAPGTVVPGGHAGDPASRNAIRQEAGKSPDAINSRSSEQQSGGWRRFGEPKGSQGAGNAQSGDPTNTRIERRGASPTDAGGTGSNADRGGWRRFGGGSSTSGSQGASSSDYPDRSSRRRQGDAQAPGSTTIERRSGSTDSPSRSGGAWQRSPDATSPRQSGGGMRSESPSQRNSEAPRMQSPRMESPRQEAPRMESRPAPGGGGGQPVRVDPPVVRERKTQDFQSFDRRSPPSAGGGGGSAFGQPRASRESSGGGSPRSGDGGGGNRGGRSR